MADEFKYWAFISYSHVDKKWGDWLHHALETYRTPKSLVGKPTQRGYPVPRRIFPIFRDREELPTSSDLGSVISQALMESRYLVVICSPNAAKSRWVSQEILDYKRLGRADFILALIVDGEPNAGENEDNVKSGMECFPETLKYSLGINGELDRTELKEPIAADVRDDKDGRKNAKLKLLAGILGVDYDALKRRDETRRRARLALTCFTAIVVACVIGATWFFQERAKLSTRSMSLILQADANKYPACYYARANMLMESHVARVNALACMPKMAFPHHVLSQESNILCIAFSPNSKMVATGSDDNTIHLWSIETATPVGKIMKASGKVIYVGFSANGKRILSGTMGGALQAWNVTTCQTDGHPIVAVEGYEPGSIDPDFGPHHEDDCRFFGEEGNFIFRRESDENTTVFTFFDIQKGVAIGKRVINTPNGIVRIEFSPDGTKAVIVLKSDIATLWDLGQGRSICQIPSSLYESFSLDGKLLFNRTSDKQGGEFVTFRNATTGQPIGKPIHTKNSLADISCSLDDKTCSTSSVEGTQKWDINSGNLVATLNYVPGFEKTKIVSPDGEWGLTTDDLYYKLVTAQIWKRGEETGILPDEATEIKEATYPYIVTSAEFSADGKHIFLANDSSFLSLLDIKKWQLEGYLTQRSTSGQILSVSEAGKFIFVGGSGNKAQIVAGKDLKGNTVLQPLQTEVMSAAFNPVKQTVSTGDSDGTIRLWDAKSGALIGKSMVDETGVWCMAFTRNGKMLASGTGRSNGGGNAIRPGIAQIWDVDRGISLRKIVASDFEIQTIGFSWNGETLFTGNEDRTVRFWDPVSGQPIGRNMLRDDAFDRSIAHTNIQTKGSVSAAAFSPDGKMLFTATEDRIIQLWDTSWLMQQISPADLLLRVQLATYHDVNAAGEIREIPLEEWLGLLEQYHSQHTAAAKITGVPK